MRVSRAKAEENRDRIVACASRLFRERGFEGVGVDALMKAVGLTHGGFYGHFRSKDDLAVEAVARGFADGEEKQKSQASVKELADGYLTEAHRDDIGGGCLLAAIGGDMARQNAGVRRPLTLYVRGQIDRIANLLRGKTEARRREQAIATLAGLVGALMIARAVDDTALSDEILEAARSVFGAGDG